MKLDRLALKILIRSSLIITIIGSVTGILLFQYYYKHFQNVYVDKLNKTTGIIQQTIETARLKSEADERVLDLRLLNISRLIADELSGKRIDEIDQKQLIEMKGRYHLDGISLFVKKPDDIVIEKSSEDKEIGLSSQKWGYWYTAFNELMNGDPVTVRRGYYEQNYWAGPISKSEISDDYFKYVYFYDGSTPFMINVFIKANNEAILTEQSFVNQIIKELIEGSPDINEISVINAKAFLLGKENKVIEPYRDLPVLYGANQFSLPEDPNLIKKTADEQKKYRIVFQKNDTLYEKTYIPLDKDRILTIVKNYDDLEEAERKSLLVLFSALIVCFFLIAYFTLLFTKKQRKLLLAEEQRLQIADEFQKTLKKLPNLIFKGKKDQNGNIVITYMEGTSAEELQLTTDKVFGKTIEEVYPPKTAPMIIAYQERVLQGEIVEYIMEFRDRYYKVISKPVWNEDGSIDEFAGYSMDITDRIKLEKELEKKEKAASEAARVKSEFLATMSHEIRTPLNAIIGMIEVLEDSLLNPQQKSYIRVCKTASDVLLRLIEDILELTKIEAGSMETNKIKFRLSRLIDETINLMKVQAEAKGLNLTAEIAPEVPETLYYDPDHLKRIMYNLLGNAIKFTERGSITLRIQLDERTESLMVSVLDTGIGIRSDQLNSIFEAFTQADSSITRKYGGTGLGLTITKRLVELAGGRIWAESEEGIGSTFYFTIPLHHPLPSS